MLILFSCFVLVSDLEIKSQKDSFEKESYAIKSDAEVKLAEIQALLESERDRYRIEVTRASLCVFTNVALKGKKKKRWKEKYRGKNILERLSGAENEENNNYNNIKNILSLRNSNCRPLVGIFYIFNFFLKNIT